MHTNYHNKKRKSSKTTRILNLDYIDVREVLDELGLDYRESGKNVGKGFIGVCCPFCGDDLNYHLGVGLSFPTLSCFRCGKGGTIINLVAKELHSYNKAIAFLKKFVPLELRTKGDDTEDEFIAKIELPTNATKTPTVWQKGYLKKRGYNWKKLHEKYDLYYCGPTGDFANRIIVPIYQRRKLVTYTSIDINTNANLRYKHLSEAKSIVPVKKLLFGLENTNGHIVCLVEGLFDQFRIGYGCVCGFGANITSEQILLLSKFPKVIIAFDGDKPGRQAARKIRDTLAVFCEVEIIHLPDGQDPDSLSKEDIDQLQGLLI